MMQAFHFIRPYYLLAFVPLALLLWALMHTKRRHSHWETLIDPALLPYVLQSHPSSHQWHAWLLTALGGTLSILALAGPSWERLPTPVFRPQAALVLALDLSLSMNSQDLAPTRLQRAQHKIIDILNQRQAGQTALLVYAAQAYTVSPLTQDTRTILAHVNTLQPDIMPAQGSRSDRALLKAQELLKQAHIREGDVLLITDDAGQDDSQAAAEALRLAGHRLSILGVGTPQGAPILKPGGGFVTGSDGSIVLPKLDEQGLKELAAQGGGHYHRITPDDRDISALLPSLNPLAMQDEATSFKTDRWHDRGYWLLFILIPLVLPVFRKGLLMLLGAALLLPVLPQSAHAMDWNSLWLNANQRGKRAFEQQQHAQAAEYFQDPAWRAAAHYRAGQYAEAVSALEGIENADAYYNKGNAQAQLGQIDQAMQSYRQALTLNPNHQDAQYNLELLKNQQQEKQHNNSSDQNQNDSADTQTQNSSPQMGDSDPAEPTNSHSQPEQENSEQKMADATQQHDGEPPKVEPDDTTQNNSGEDTNSTLRDETMPLNEQEQAAEQWLRRIPDDPGGLLRRKFKYQYGRQPQPQDEKQQW